MWDLLVESSSFSPITGPQSSFLPAPLGLSGGPVLLYSNSCHLPTRPLPAPA